MCVVGELEKASFDFLMTQDLIFCGRVLTQAVAEHSFFYSAPKN